MKFSLEIMRLPRHTTLEGILRSGKSLDNVERLEYGARVLTESLALTERRSVLPCII